LWITQDDGAATRRVASSVSGWAWSPDGEAIAATPAPIAGRASRGIDFYAIDLPHVRLTLLRDYHAVDFAWAGLGRRIAVSASPVAVEPGRDHAALFMLEVAGPYADCATLCPEPAVPVTIAGPQTRDQPLLLAAWSPHASTLTVWTTNERGGDPAELALVSPGGGTTVPFAHTPIDRSRIQWSEAGDRLLVLESGREHPTSTETLTLCVPPLGCHAVEPAGQSAVDPAWSDDGRMAYVAATATESTSTTPGVSGRDLRLWIADGDGHGASAVARGDVSAPRWLPDARHLVFVRDHQLWLLDTTRGTAKAIAGPLGIRRRPRGHGISQTDQLTNPRQLFTVSP
jgi:dipeptidyl aminopeptidase/acylaminoacyl peptidase